MTTKRIVAVVSDFGAGSFYVGVMKGVVHAAAPDCHVVDLTHSIRPHAVGEASFVLDYAFDYFPTGTVFLTVVDPGVGGARKNLVVEARGRYLVGPDNGFTTEVLARAEGSSCCIIDEEKTAPYRVGPPVGRTFLGRDVFAPAAAALAAGKRPADIGEPVTTAPATLDLPPVEVGAGRITGRARYVDDFGNVLTGITGHHLRSAIGDMHAGRIAATIDGDELGALCRYYSERSPGTVMALLNAWDRVEVSVCEGRAADRFAGRPLHDVVIELRAKGGR